MTKKVVKGILAGLLTAVFGGFGSVASCQDLNPLEMPTVNEDSVMKHIVELSSERYAGRLAGSNGYNEALYYAEQVLRTYGATLDRQVFEIECNEIENCKFNTYTPGTKEKTVYTLGNEFCCAGMTGRGYVDAQMVFCGYGIDNELMNEYKTVDVRGKIAIVLSGLPEGGWIPQDIAARYRLAPPRNTVPSACSSSTPATAAAPTSPRAASTAATCPTSPPSPSSTSRSTAAASSSRAKP